MTNIFDDFAAVALRLSDRPAVEVCHRSGVDILTYGDMDALAVLVAGLLLHLGAAPGARCALLADNDARWCGAYLGILRLGAVVVPLDTAYRAAQVRTVIADCGATFLLASPRYADVARDAVRGLASPPRLVLTAGRAPDAASIEDAIAGTLQVPAPPPCPASAADPAVTLYTSGTTSDPKGVVLTHGNLLAEKAAVFRVVHVDERDAILGVLPLFHALAQVANLLLPLTAGARVVYLDTVNSAEMMRAFTERRITAFCVVPQFYYLLHQRIMERVAASPLPVRALFRTLLAVNTRLRRHLGLNAGRAVFRQAHGALGGRMRILVSGGSRFDPRIGRDLYGMGFNILQAYGLTECSGAATVTRPGDHHVDAVGQALEGVQIRIASEPAQARDREHADGEILIKGPIVMTGYHNRPDVNAITLTDGWLHTGDLGYLDARGRLYITGRKKEVIVLASGKNIYPEEIEAKYVTSPFIKELCVMGIALRDEPAAERLHAIVVPDLDVMRERRVVNFREIIRFDIEGLSLDLPPHKRVLSFDIWLEDLPRTTTRKLKRFEIERLYRERAARADQPAEAAEWTDADDIWASDPHVSRALAAIRAVARHGSAVAPDAHLELDLGLDSMERVELLSSLEHACGVDVPDEAAQRIFTVRDLVEATRPSSPAGAAGPAQADPWTRLLTDDTDDPVLQAVLRPKPLFTPLAFASVKLLNVLARLVGGLRVRGLEHLPPSGPFLLSPNHQSYLDGFLLVGALPYALFTRLFFVGASEYFATPATRKLAELWNVVPVDPDANLVKAMQAGAFGLRHNRVLVLFPEGERSPDGAPRRFKKGAAITALQMGVPIVPVAIHGVFEVWPRGKGLQWRRMLPWAGTRATLEFGPPLLPDATSPAPAATRYDRHTAALRDAIVRMWQDLASYASQGRPGRPKCP
jgi:long-chain acyl-CoA synthetase